MWFPSSMNVPENNYSFLADRTTNVMNNQSFDFATAKANIIANYVEITDLPINLILQELLLEKVILSRQMEVIQTKSLQSDRMEYIIDKIIVSNLDMKISTNYYKLLEVMEKSGNDKLSSMAQKLEMNRPEHPPFESVKNFAPQPFTTLPTTSFNFAAINSKITANYVELVNLPIELIRRDLFAKKVITFRQKEQIETMHLQHQKMEYIIDKVIVPTLKLKISTVFKRFLEAMEESGNEEFISMAHTLGGSKAVPQ